MALIAGIVYELGASAVMVACCALVLALAVRHNRRDYSPYAWRKRGR